MPSLTHVPYFPCPVFRKTHIRCRTSPLVWRPQKTSSPFPVSRATFSEKSPVTGHRSPVKTIDLTIQRLHAQKLGKRLKVKGQSAISGNVARKTENVAAKPLIRFNDFTIQRFNKSIQLFNSSTIQQKKKHVSHVPCPTVGDCHGSAFLCLFPSGGASQ